MAVQERAVVEFFHSRSVVPTRRLSLGKTALDGRSGRLLIAKVVARFVGELDVESEVDLDELLQLAENYRRVPQPQVRYRLQTDQVGLARTTDRLVITNGRLCLEVSDNHTPPIAHLLAALYASQSQPDLLQTFRQCFEERTLWQHGQFREAARDLLPTSAVEALELMEFDENDVSAQKVRERYRLLLRAAHPDSGGDPGRAADRIRSLNEARALLLANLN
ncbi:MAG: J domain-containing protein [Acidimicrobiales bacterium]|nr:J domain-containing protein [Acidimicrobiales bacterium]